MVSAAILIILGAAVFRAVDVAPVPPVSKWVVNHANESCVATRVYLVDGKEVALALEPRPMGDGMRLLLQTKGRQRGITREKARIRVGEERLGVENVVAYPSAKAGHAVYTFGATPGELEKLAEAQRLGLAVSGGPKLDLQVADLRAVLGSLDKCISGLLVSWGLSEADQARMASPPQPNGPIFGPADYPADVISKSGVGDVGVRVWLDAEGRASNCRVLQSSGHDSLDEATCRAMLRARFAPAMDKEGRPMASPYYARTAWRIMY